MNYFNKKFKIADGSLKLAIFGSIICAISFLKNFIFPLSGGFATRFGGSEAITRTMGFPLSGVLINVIAFACTFYSENLASRYQFIFYLFLSDCLVFFHCVKRTFFLPAAKKICTPSELTRNN